MNDLVVFVTKMIFLLNLHITDASSVNRGEILRMYSETSSQQPSPQPTTSFGDDFDAESLTPNDYFHIKIISSKDGIFVQVDSHEVIRIHEEKKNSTIDFRNTTNGLHCVVLHPKHGTVMAKKIFMTELFAESIGIAPTLSSFSANEIFLFAVKFDAGLNLANMVRHLFHSMGAAIVHSAVYRSYFVWVFTKGGRTFLESLINDDVAAVGDFYTSPIKAEVLVPRSTEVSCWDDALQTRKDIVEQRRAKFCEEYGGYGQLCDCESPTDINFPEKELSGNVIDNVPVLIIASNRPQALYRCIVTLLTQPGGKRRNILVMVDGYHKQVVELLQIFQISYIVNSMDLKTSLTKSSRISIQYKVGLSSVFQRFPQSTFVIVLEEDILTAPNFLSYFNQTAKILASDPSLYCSCAWNDLSAMHTGGNPHKVMRLESQPAYGWMITRNFFEEVKLYWDPEAKDSDWDIWFRGPWVRASRECLVPEVSRSFHMGESGAHIKGQMTYAHFLGHLITVKENILLDALDRLTEERYEEEIYSVLESDNVVFLNTSVHPCYKLFLPRNYTEKIIVIFFSMDSIQDSQGWLRLASCVGLFNMDTRDHHRGLFRFYFYDTQVFAIGYPFSDYSYLKPNYVVPVSPYMNEWDEKNMNQMTLQNRKRFRVPHLEKHLPYPLLLDEPKPQPTYVVKYI